MNRRPVQPRFKLYSNAAIGIAAFVVVMIGVARPKTGFVVAWLVLASVGVVLAAYNCMLAILNIRDSD
ncbi:MAG TPA: hypothetical protein VFA99_01825 [Acidobacteriaceae bacterium]|nr:hypothetical protein [Acidobacteriaceae bacterium]